MSSVWGMILQWGSTIKVSTELPVATRHNHIMTEKLLKATLYPNKQQQMCLIFFYIRKMTVAAMCVTVVIMPPTLKLMRHVGFRLSVHACLHSKLACHTLRTMHARVLKLHIWIPHGKIAGTHSFSCPSSPFLELCPFKKIGMMHAISCEPSMLGFWNFIYGFLMEK